MFEDDKYKSIGLMNPLRRVVTAFKTYQYQLNIRSISTLTRLDTYMIHLYAQMYNYGSDGQTKAIYEELNNNKTLFR